MNKTRALLVLTAVGLLAWAQNDGPGAGQGWLPEFNHSSRQILALAEATPAEKFAWRPAPGVRRSAKSTCTSPSPTSSCCNRPESS